MKCWVEGSREPWTVCEHGMVTLDWEAGHCYSPSYSEHSLDSIARGDVPNRDRDSHCDEHSTTGKAYITLGEIARRTYRFMGFNLSQPHSGDVKAFPEQSPPA